MSLSETLEACLRRHAIEFATSVHRSSPTSEAAAHAARVREEHVAKGVVLGDERGYVLAVLPASRRLDLERVRGELGRALHLVPESDLDRLFPDCATGAIPPIGAAYGLPTIVDAVLERQAEVFFEAGDHETLVCVDGASFLDLLDQAEVAEISVISPGLEAARVARERLYENGLAVGRAISAPIGRGARWRQRVGRALERLAEGLDVHVSESEGPDGVLREIVGQAPRLWREVEALEQEHVELAEACSLLQRHLQGGGSALVIRKGTLELLQRLAAHRHRGADLVYEAFGVDLGGG
jgi:Ala-tRNA(Pro) deacylase